MLKTILPCVVAALISTVTAGEGWLLNIEEGVKQANEKGKVTLVEFTGSDWCGPCMMLKSSVFDSPEFKEFAEKELILVELDAPRKKEISEDQKAYVAQKKEEFKVRGVPSVFLLDKEGKPFFVKVGGTTDKEGYIKTLKEGIDNREKVAAAFAKAEKAEGMDKAKLLNEAIGLMDINMAETMYPHIIAEIITLDEKDTFGFKSKKDSKEKLQTQFKSMSEELAKISALSQEKKWTEAEELIYTLLKNDDLHPQVRFYYVNTLISTHLQQDDFDGATEATKLLKDCKDPSSPEMTKMIEERLKLMETNKEEFLKSLKEMRERMKNAIPATKMTPMQKAEKK